MLPTRWMPRPLGADGQTQCGGKLHFKASTNFNGLTLVARGLRRPGGSPPRIPGTDPVSICTHTHTYTHTHRRTSVTAGAVMCTQTLVHDARGHRLSRREGGERPRHPGGQVESSGCPPCTRTPVHPYTCTPVHPYTRTPVNVHVHLLRRAAEGRVDFCIRSPA